MEHRPETADVIREYGEAYRQRYRTSSEQRRVLNDLAQCRTAALGGHLKRCESCGHEVPVYNSCRNRHCPKCQAAARARWLVARQQELLDVEYFHVVFTLPHELAPLALQNRCTVYGMLFRAASQTLLTLGRDPNHLGAELACLAVLHTWGQTLHHHPHLHCVVPGGGLSLNGQRWVSCRNGFLLPVRLLSRLFQGKFLAELQRAWERQKLRFHGRLQDLEHPKPWEAFIESLRANPWVVYAKPPFGGPVQVLKYLARYIHCVAISNQRLLSLQNAKLTFRYKDYTHQSVSRTMTLDAVECLRRFLLHVLPRGFMRIRYYGFLANRHRAEKLQRIRLLLASETASSQHHPFLSQVEPLPSNVSGSDSPELCPQCKKGRLILVARFQTSFRRSLQHWSFDSS